MLKMIYLVNGERFVETDIKNIPQIIEQKPKLAWLDIALEDNDSNSEEISLLSNTFHFHELSIEDCLIPQYHPKVEEFENYIFIAMHGTRCVSNCENFEDLIYEIDMFILKDCLVTVHTEEISILDNMFAKAKTKPSVDLKSIEYLLYIIFGKILNSYEFYLEQTNDTLDKIEDKLLENPSQELMSEIFSFKKTVLALRKITEPQKNIYLYFTRETLVFFPKKSIAYFRDIYFQYDRLTQALSSFNQIIGSVLEVYVSGVTLKLNEVIKFLTIIATILMPALLITGYYGMNVAFPEYKIFGNSYVWYFAFFLMLASTLGVYIYVKKKKWF